MLNKCAINIIKMHLGLILLVLASCSNEHINNPSENYKKGMEYYDRGEYENAFIWLLKAGTAGFPAAQYKLGIMYYGGKGMKSDKVKSAEWYRLAAEQGYAKAQCNLGYMYDQGKGVKQSYLDAYKWYCMAAEQGNANAQFNLGNMYYLGEGVNQSYTEALIWYRKAAENGDIDAQFILGSIYYAGHDGIEQNYIEAAKWLLRPASQGNGSAQVFLGVLYANGKGGIKQNINEAKRWLNTASICNDSTARADAYRILKEIDAAIENSQYYLELITWSWAVSYDYANVVGQVKNISNCKLDKVMALVSFYDQNDNFITYENGFIEYTPILNEQVSPFKIMLNYNPAMHYATIYFKYFSGEAIPTIIPDHFQKILMTIY